MKKQTICLALSPCIIAGYLLANNMFSHKPQMQNENIISYNNINLKVDVKLSLNGRNIKPLQGIAGIDTYSYRDLKDTKEEKVKVNKKKEIKKKNYSEEELMLLAGIVQNEAGSSFCSSELQMAVASVVINRVKSDYFPDTIEGVITQKGQYAINYKALYNPTKRAIKNARYVLENGSTLPDNCIFQAEFVQGKIYKVFKTKISTIYICYKE